jgi:uncharacterized Zn finger protein (UPF0148 family)
MVSIFGRSEDEHERLLTTVQSLGVTSVPGLAAALSWRVRKTEKMLAHELARPGTQLVYEPARRLVRWRRPLPPPPPPGDSAPAASADVARGVRGASRLPAVLRGTVLKVLCPSCHVPLVGTGSGMLAVCPECGRLSSEKNPDAPRPAAAAPAPSMPAAAPAPPAAPRPSEPSGDRHSQELFAAYVTSRPIPCPRCRTPLRHRGVAEYSCPSCGQAVQFGKATGPPVTIRAT